MSNDPLETELICQKCNELPCRNTHTAVRNISTFSCHCVSWLTNTEPCVDGLVQVCNISIANALDLLQYWTEPWMYMWIATAPSFCAVVHYTVTVDRHIFHNPTHTGFFICSRANERTNCAFRGSNTKPSNVTRKMQSVQCCSAGLAVCQFSCWPIWTKRYYKSI